MNLPTKKKILAFDAWTQGKHHFERLVAPCKENNIKITLVHIGSWGDEKNTPPHIFNNGLEIRDIKSYRTNSLSKLLDIEQPNVVIMLSTDSFANRAMIRLCKMRNIPTLHHLHGLQNTNEQIGGQPFKTNVFRRLWALNKQVVKGFLYAWPTYLKSLISTQASLKEWKRFGYDLKDRLLGIRPVFASEDSQATNAVVFIPSEKDVISEIYGYKKQSIFAIGNPDLLKFEFLSCNLFQKNNKIKTNKILYVDGCLLNYGWVYQNKNEFCDHLLDTAKYLAKEGFELIWKPHPAHEIETFHTLKNKIKICDDKNFMEITRECAAVITEPSSAGLLPMLLGKPVFLTGYGPWRGQRFGTLFRNYPRSKIMQSLTDLDKHQVSKINEKKETEVVTWSKKHVGPLPPEKIGKRVIEICIKLMEG